MHEEWNWSVMWRQTKIEGLNIGFIQAYDEETTHILTIKKGCINAFRDFCSVYNDNVYKFTTTIKCIATWIYTQ